MYRITRDIHFSYGHRLTKHAGKCARLHGHNARVQVELSSQVLDEQAMVTDFEHVSETIGAWIRKELDHKMLLWEKDPAAALLIKAGEHVVLLKEHPTAEVLARLIFKEAQLLRLPVSRVIFWETVNSCASYHE
jgi:6-pyruvoyltetrahydropterin/6-carboxytetrahydropterin synthase